MGESESVATAAASEQLHLLVMDDDLPVLRACCEIASMAGFTVHAANSAERARELIRSRNVDVVLMELNLGGGGTALLEDIRVQRPRAAIVVMTVFATVSSAVEAMRLGATDYLTKPFEMAELTGVLERAGQRRQFEIESKRLQERLQAQNGTGTLIGSSQEMERLYRMISKVAFSAHPVLIHGESGTGKKTVAKTIHAHGARAAKPFTVIECRALTQPMLESELFGFVRGAFTGASRPKEGVLGSPDGGTVLLEDVDALSLDLQGKLIRTLQDKAVRPAGATQPVPLTVRVLTSTQRNLSALVEQGNFRKDLFYRLNVVTLRIPSLRDRRLDIPLLAEHFLERIRNEDDIRYRFATDALRSMSDYDWPGNITELESVVERTCALASGPVLGVGDLPSTLKHVASTGGPLPLLRVDHRRSASASSAASPAPIVSIAEMEKNAIITTIRQLNGDKLMAAKLLGIGKTTLYRKLKEYGISAA